MNERKKISSPIPSTVRWSVWLIYLLLWTTALLIPLGPSGDLSIAGLRISLKFVVGKSLHVTAYAGFAVLSAWLHFPPKWRWLLIVFLMMHATLTEMGQEFTGRSGSLADVLIDQIGITVGLLLSWKSWRATTDHDKSADVK